MEYLSKPITQEDIDKAEHCFSLHGEPFNKEGLPGDNLVTVYYGQKITRLYTLDEIRNNVEGA